MTSSPVQIHALWDRPFLPPTGGTAILCLHVAATATAPAARPALDIAFILDRSGSMTGEPLELVCEGASIALDFLDERDRVALVTFDHQDKLWQELAPLTATAKTRLRQHLDRITPGGSTDLTQGWQQGCAQLAHGMTSSGRVRRAILLTDGQANTGIVDSATIARLATRYRHNGINTSTIGVGAHFDELLLSSTSEAGGGNFKYIQHPAELPAFFASETGDMTRIVATAPRLRLTLEPGVTGELLNAFPASINDQALDIELRDLIAGDTLDLIFELTIPPGSGNRTLSATLQLGNGESIAIPLPQLGYRPASDIASIAPNPEVLQKHAVEHSTRARRDAIRLDREGNISASRDVLRQASVRLQAAPASAETMKLSMELETLARMDMAFDENTRKRVVHESQATSRGYRR